MFDDLFDEISSMSFGGLDFSEQVGSSMLSMNNFGEISQQFAQGGVYNGWGQQIFEFKDNLFGDMANFDNMGNQLSVFKENLFGDMANFDNMGNQLSVFKENLFGNMAQFDNMGNQLLEFKKNLFGNMSAYVSDPMSISISGSINFLN